MKDLVQTVIEAGNFKTLITAVQEAGLVETLQQEGPFTIFAPTDEAFEKLPDGTIKALLNDKEKLTEILTYHVLANKIMSKDVVNIKNATTANGKKISINSKECVKIDNANVIKTDIECTNGVIHVIDTVLIPK